MFEIELAPVNDISNETVTVIMEKLLSIRNGIHSEADSDREKRQVEVPKTPLSKFFA